MLNLSERFMALQWNHSCSVLACLPVAVDLQSWRISLNISEWKQHLSLFLYIILLLKCLFKAVRLLRTLVASEATPLHHITLHMTVLQTFIFLCIWYYILYHQHPDVHCATVTMTLRGNLIGQRKY